MNIKIVRQRIYNLVVKAFKHFYMYKLALMLGYSLVEDVCKDKDYDSEQWWNIFNNMIVNTLKLDNCHLLSESAKLAAALAIIGSRKLAYYPLAFQFLIVWNISGGCYWIVQEEIIRHAILYKIRGELLDSDSFQSNEGVIINSIMDELSSIKLCDNTSSAHKILYGRIEKLKIEMKEFIEEINDNHDSLGTFYKYCGKYPLSSFIPWVIKWGRSLLAEDYRNHINLPVLLRLQYDLECKKNLSVIINNMKKKSIIISNNKNINEKKDNIIDHNNDTEVDVITTNSNNDIDEVLSKHPSMVVEEIYERCPQSNQLGILGNNRKTLYSNKRIYHDLPSIQPSNRSVGDRIQEISSPVVLPLNASGVTTKNTSKSIDSTNSSDSTSSLDVKTILTVMSDDDSEEYYEYETQQQPPSTASAILSIDPLNNHKENVLSHLKRTFWEMFET